MSVRPLLWAAALALPLSASAGFTASSHKKESRSAVASPYDASAALDGNPSTAWLVDPEQDNEGQWIELDVPKGTIIQIKTVVGWAESDETWKDHARLKTARLELFSMVRGEKKLVHEQELSFEDTQEPQAVAIPKVKVGDELSGGKVRLTVTGVYEGKDYDHLGLGEFLVYLEDFEALSRDVESVSSTAEGTEKDALVDDSTRTFWASEAKDEAPTVEVSGGRYSINAVGLLPGPSSYDRPKTIEVTQGGSTRTYEVADKATMQWFELPAMFGYSGSNFGPVTITVTATHGEGGKGVAIADVKFKAVAIEAF